VNPFQSTMPACVIAALQDLPDPRGPRGVRYAWWVLLAIVLAALLAGCDHPRAMAQWAADQVDSLAAYLPLPGRRAPSESTLQRTLRQLDPALLARWAARVQNADQPAVVLEGLSIDGKSMRAACKSGAPLHVLEVARHGDGALLGLLPVGVKQNEYSASPGLLAGFDLVNRVLTGDAMFCQRRLAGFIGDRGGFWLFAVKANQPALLADLTAHFEAPRGGPHRLEMRCADTTGHDHGRRERRHLEASADLADQLDWPGARQVIRRTLHREIGGQESIEHSYWLTSLPPERANAARLEVLCRGHWTIENQVNWSRDVTFGEDRCMTRTGHAPLALAMFRSVARWLLRYGAHFAFVPDARRHYACRPGAALELLGARRL